MHFEFRHRFPVSADALWALLRDDAYQDEANQEANVRKDVLEEREDLGVRFKRIRVFPQRALPPAMARALGTDSLSYVQEQRWRDDKKLMNWVVIPDVMASRVHCKGDYRISDRGRGECERLITGEIRISVPVVGSRMEKKTVEDLRGSYDATAVLMRRWIDAGKVG